MKIFLLEDDPTDLNKMENTLKENIPNCRVIKPEKYELDSCINRVISDKPQILLLDVNIHGETLGFELCNRLKEGFLKNNKCVIVFISIHAQKYQSDAFTISGYKLFSKPLSVTDISTIITYYTAITSNMTVEEIIFGQLKSLEILQYNLKIKNASEMIYVPNKNNPSDEIVFGEILYIKSRTTKNTRGDGYLSYSTIYFTNEDRIPIPITKGLGVLKTHIFKAKDQHFNNHLDLDFTESDLFKCHDEEGDIPKSLAFNRLHYKRYFSPKKGESFGRLKYRLFNSGDLFERKIELNE